jgi:methylated-DNA-protein-cysteine methyltransferase-like protein
VETPDGGQRVARRVALARAGGGGLRIVAAMTGDEAVLRRVRAIPEGFVRSYGDVSPGAPRFAGTVLHRCSDPSLPWHRVVRTDGSLAKGERQRALLEAEGVPFAGDRVDMRVARLPAHVAAP